MKQIGAARLPSEFCILLFACLMSGFAVSASTNSETYLHQNTIRGTVFDETGQPLPGISITEKRTSNGVVTDFEENFSTTPKTDNDILVASPPYIGYKTQEVLAKSDVRIHMMLESQALRGIAAIGQRGKGQTHTRFTFPVKAVVSGVF